MLQKSGSGRSSSYSIVMAGYAGLVLLLGGLVADPGVSEGDPAGPGLQLVVHGVPEVYLEEHGVQVHVLVVGHLAHNAAGCRTHASLGQRFLPLLTKKRGSFILSQVSL